MTKHPLKIIILLLKKEAGMKVCIGSDHRGYKLKEELKDYMKEKGIEFVDLGTDSEESVDYPDYAISVAEKVANGECEFGVLICYTGVGMSIAANKVKGVRAAHVVAPIYAKMARLHNDANVLCLPGGFITKDKAIECLELFISTEFEGGRHKRRVDKIINYEENH